ncbi:MAG: MBL fold metallo-hydrolase [Candidatus Diapherotrites archaeon]|jgi:glyoxylase-like metal-dependent hydrolase (beta-lactamase superfamily II)|uniref:Metallo-beta-lactamase domain-containing protein 1 n=1 Tax=Candidatus Iainarchaeum sp. TaxID=3101447 RepID=A0A8T5GFQ2_9ARCH|nr:MBL fold metallo-hydrolase [Candidatus Diapherotrites archaeon]MBT7241514.1 MBL fold metallo-hydrolase [Candidatus Diapherotrites archaeon]
MKKKSDMVAEVKVLIEGSTNADGLAEGEEERSWPTITLIKDNGLNIVTDPGTLRNQRLLIDALAKENLTVDTIDMVFLTHSHIDHFRNVGMFPTAKVLEFYGIWEEDTVEEWKEQFSEDIQIIKTPGHIANGLTFLVKTKKGVVGVVGDVFWKENFPEKDEYASDLAKLAESRKLVLREADFIIPGHGPLFKVKK